MSSKPTASYETIRPTDPVHLDAAGRSATNAALPKSLPDYVANRIEELRVQGQQLMHNQRCLNEDIEAAREAGLLY